MGLSRVSASALDGIEDAVRKRADELSYLVIGAAIEVHRQLGPGLLESAYQQCLALELTAREIPFQREVAVPVVYRGHSLDCGYRLDLLVGDALIIEVKAVETALPIHEAQLLTYMRLARKPVGLLMNFHSTVLKDNIYRRVL
jgi:GxxExxY protein